LQRVFFGGVLKKFDGVVDADKLERVYCTVFITVIFLIGIYPMILTDVIKTGIAPIATLFGG